MRIANNFPTLSAFTSLNRTNKSLQKSIKTLSTGLRLNSASDDAAGFAIAEKMRSQLSGLDRAIQNSQDGVSLLQTAEGALGETNSMLLRMRELSLQACNDSLTSQDRQYLQLEIDELKKQIDKIAGTTQFNRKRILDGSSGALWSSSDLNVKAKINGGLTYVDQFGQKISSEGNYRIEVKAKPGQPQVQKSNIFNVAEYGIDVEIEKVTEPITQTIYEVETITETITEMVTEIQRTTEIVTITATQEVPHIIRLNEGIDSIEQTSGDGWAFENGSLIITGNGTYDIRGTVGANPARSPNIIVKAGAEANIFLTDVNIDKSSTGKSMEQLGEAAFQIESGASANVWLAGNNSLKSGAGRAGLEVPDGATLRLSSADGDGMTTGTLIANNNSKGAGIGGAGYPSSQGRAGNISIYGGKIEAKGGMGCAGIGGGDTESYDGGGHIFIAGGDITAWGGEFASAIGSGYMATAYHTKTRTSDNTVIEIYGGKVKAYGGSADEESILRSLIYDVHGAGIGGSAYSGAGTIIINKQLIENGDVVAVSGGTGAERIGHGTGGDRSVYENKINLNADVPVTYGNAPDRPMITAEVPIGTEEREIYTEVTTPVTRQVTRQITKKVDKVIGEQVVDEIPIIRGLSGDFVFKPKKLSDISQFYDESGKSLVSQPQTITITQGNGKTASITLYETDTIDDVAKKINNAISETLGQGKYTDSKNKFCTIADGTENTSESVYRREPIYAEEGYLSEYGLNIPAGTLIGYKVTSTMLVRSAVPGRAGELYFSGDEDLLNALGLNTIQSSTETTCTATVYDAHSGQRINEMKAEGQEFKSIIPPEIDIEVDPMTGLIANWDEHTKRFMMVKDESYSAMIHLKDNGITFQTGANRGEDFMIQLGDTSCDSLGISGINVLTRESASRALSIIDRAINKISSQRAKIGAYQNALEDTMTNLTTTSANVTSAVSRISDADMAHETMNLVKLQILNQSGTSMLSQANQLPKSVMNLMQ